VDIIYILKDKKMVSCGNRIMVNFANFILCLL
jgi:hypothetical protein